MDDNYLDKCTQKYKTVVTKCSENYFVSENLVDSDDNWSVDSDGGGINPMMTYDYSKNTLSKHKSCNAERPIAINLSAAKANKNTHNLSLMGQNFLGKKIDSRNQYYMKSRFPHCKSHEVAEGTLE